MRKKLLAIVLVCFMMVSMFPVAAFATDADHDHTNEEVICPGEGKVHTKDNCTSEFVKTIDAVCNEWGYTIWQCTACGAYFATDFNKLEEDAAHQHVLVAEEVPPTCTEPGKTAVYNCELCENDPIGGVEIPALGGEHDWVEGESTGNCEDEGLLHYTCSICGDTKTEGNGTGAGHVWGDPVITKEPSVENGNGVAVYTCEKCGFEKEVTVLFEHDHEMLFHEAVAHTCKEDGTVAYYECLICGKTYADEAGETELTAEDLIDEAAHNYVGDSVVKEATCTEFGFELLNPCTVCGAHEDVKVITPTGHTGYGLIECGCEGEEACECDGTDCADYECEEGKCIYIDYTVAEGDCENATVITWNCGNCGELLTETQDAAGHTTVTVNVPATCRNFAYSFTYCTNEYCSTPKVVAGWKDGYTYYFTVNEDGELDGSMGWSPTEDMKTRVISWEITGTELDPTNHGHWVRVEELNAPTCTEEGDGMSYCTCGNMEEEFVVIDALGHDWVAGEPENVATAKQCQKTVYDCSRCDDTTTEYDTEHSYPEEGVVYAPTCQADGYTSYVCEDCGYEDKRDVIEFVYDVTTIYGDQETAEIGHDLSTEYKVLREGTCTVQGLFEYTCTACNKAVLVKDPATGNGHVAPADLIVTTPTCEKPGLAREYVCGECGETVAEAVIPALGHKLVNYEAQEATCEQIGWDAYVACGLEGCNYTTYEEIPMHNGNLVEVEEKAATCTEAGWVKHYLCEACGVKLAIVDGEIDETVEVDIEAGAHSMTVTDNRTVSCVEFGYAHNECANCDYEYIDAYAVATGHIEIEGEYVAPGHDTDGKQTYVCETCGKELRAEVIPAVGHTNAAGEIFFDDCQDTVEDRICVDGCNEGEEIGTTCNDLSETYVPATCLEFGYTLIVCNACGEETIEIVDDLLADHDWVEVGRQDATTTEAGWIDYECSVEGCEETKRETIAADADIIASLEITNANGATEEFTDSSLISVKINLNADNVEVWGVLFNVNYDKNAVEFVDHKFVSNKLITTPLVNDNDGYVTVLASAPNSADGKTQNALIEGEEAFVILTFRVNSKDATSAAFSINECEAQNADEDVEVTLAGESAEIEIKTFLDVNGDEDVNLADVLIVSQMITGVYADRYDVSVDVNKDGEVNVTDFVALCNYIVGAQSYDELVGRAVVE